MTHPSYEQRWAWTRMLTQVRALRDNLTSDRSLLTLSDEQIGSFGPNNTRMLVADALKALVHTIYHPDLIKKEWLDWHHVLAAQRIAPSFQAVPSRSPLAYVCLKCTDLHLCRCRWKARIARRHQPAGFFSHNIPSRDTFASQ